MSSQFLSESIANSLQDLITCCTRLYNQGQCPGTSGNFSIRSASDRMLITVSGRHKGRLENKDFMEVNFEDCIYHRHNENDSPSAETALHQMLYQRFPDVGTVLHTHSVMTTVLSRYFAKHGYIAVDNYELLKIFGLKSHEESVKLPIVENSQDMADILGSLAPIDKDITKACAYLIAGHGLYVWGPTVAMAEYRLEAWDFLLNCIYAELSLPNR
ncbi:MAG: methylthioribulose 1-phosphate dehydratase [Pseudomonadota bacterium]